MSCYTVYDVDETTAHINEDVSPISITIIPSHLGFDGEVLKAEFPIKDFVAGCSYACDPHGDEVPDC